MDFSLNSMQYAPKCVCCSLKIVFASLLMNKRKRTNCLINGLLLPLYVHVMCFAVFFLKYIAVLSVVGFV